jgi:hypothetical protein
VRWNIAAARPGVDGQHPDLVRILADEIDQPDTAALSHAEPLSSDLSHASGTRNQAAGLWIFQQKLLNLGILDIVQIKWQLPLINA